MNRKKFMASLLGLVGVATSARDLAKLAPKPVIADVPGIGGSTFKIKLDRDWFKAGDVIINTQGRQFYCTGDTLIDTKTRDVIGVDWGVGNSDCVKVCSVVSEGEEKARWIDLSDRKLFIGKLT